MFENSVKDELRGGSNENSTDQQTLQPVLGPDDLENKNHKGQSSTFAQNQEQIEEELEPILGPQTYQEEK